MTNADSMRNAMVPWAQSHIAQLVAPLNSTLASLEGATDPSMHAVADAQATLSAIYVLLDRLRVEFAKAQQSLMTIAFRLNALEQSIRNGGDGALQ